MTPSPSGCAVAVAPGNGEEADRAEAVAAVAALSPSPYLTARALQVDGAGDGPAWRGAAVEAAVRRGDDWIFFVAPGERPAPDLLALLAPAARAYDAVWGGIGIRDPSGRVEVPRLARFSCRDEVNAFHMALQWWVGRSHLLRLSAAAAEPYRSDAGEGWYADFSMRQWARGHCLKTAQPLTLADELPPVAEADRRRLLAELDARPRAIDVGIGDVRARLPYTGRNPTLERVQLRGIFFEAAELAALKDRVGPGATVVDVGANTGNHTVFFATAMQAARVIPVEPNPRACAALRWAIEANALTNIDFSCLGMGVGARSGLAEVVVGTRGHLGTGALAPSPNGNTQVAILDDLVDGRADLIKIDAEGMELEVLHGARGLIRRCRPILMIEVADGRLAAFLPLVDELGYAVEDVFADEGYANYLLAPS